MIIKYLSNCVQFWQGSKGSKAAKAYTLPYDIAPFQGFLAGFFLCRSRRAYTLRYGIAPFQGFLADFFYAEAEGLTPFAEVLRPFRAFWRDFFYAEAEGLHPSLWYCALSGLFGGIFFMPKGYTLR